MGLFLYPLMKMVECLLASVKQTFGLGSFHMSSVSQACCQKARNRLRDYRNTLTGHHIERATPPTIYQKYKNANRSSDTRTSSRGNHTRGRRYCRQIIGLFLFLFIDFSNQHSSATLFGYRSLADQESDQRTGQALPGPNLGPRIELALIRT